MASLYDTDFYAWSQQTSQKLRDGQLEPEEWDNVIEEIEDLGKFRYDALVSAYRELMAHRLKWDFQAEKRTRSWLISINKQITKIESLLEANPSLRSKSPEIETKAYQLAIRQAARETGLDPLIFPTTCSYTFEELLSSVGTSD